MSALRTTGRGHAALETAGAWLLALIWILPLAYALWAAIHPSAYSAHFVLDAPLTLRELRQRLERGAIRALFPQHLAARRP